MDKAPLQYRFDELKAYTLEVYGPADHDSLLWKHDSDTPFTAMARGDRLHLPDAPKARSDAPYRIVDIEHVIWTHGESVRVVTRLTVERA
jgi:hypothetical protein